MATLINISLLVLSIVLATGRNLLNTHLASVLDSAVFYPTLNIGMILLSLAMSIIIFKESFTRRHAFVLAFAFSGMILVNLPS
ncbi:MAG: hypothetical protein IJ391_04515 [Clostridia bacterium]|nr:hypothetical protein [Clostridia bacterium]